MVPKKHLEKRVAGTVALAAMAVQEAGDTNKRKSLLKLSLFDLAARNIMSKNEFKKLPKRQGIVLGGGLAGLAAAYTLTEAGIKTVIFESEADVGGLSKTIAHNGYLFDIGGHRFITKDPEIEKFINSILAENSITVDRKSKILMWGKYFDYPLKPTNAIFGLSLPTTVQVVWDYVQEKITSLFKTKEIISLEDWVVKNFGRKMFDLYFKGYSEKVWGIDCSRISQAWIAERIKGLSLWKAIKNAFLKWSGRKIPTLADKFIYPLYGIGEISNRMKKIIEDKNGEVATNTRVIKIEHKDFQIQSIELQNGQGILQIDGDQFISSIPLSNLVQMLSPAPPLEILQASQKLGYRDLITVTLMLNREQVTDLTWLYFPDKDIPFGRLHEPKNWSPQMAPPGKTHVVIEYFCFKGDAIWNTTDSDLVSLTIKHLEKLNLAKKEEILDSYILRAANAYPLFEIGYEKYQMQILDYLKNFKNLQISGRSGLFEYYNMDLAVDSGFKAANKTLAEFKKSS
jgi:protoporphyrinogen oxidase